MAYRAVLNNRDRQKLRDKIKADKIIRELQAFALGIKLKRNNGEYHVPKLTTLKVKALFGLLDRILPTIKAEEVIVEKTEKTRVISSEVLSEEDWLEKYGPKDEELPENVTSIADAKK